MSGTRAETGARPVPARAARGDAPIAILGGGPIGLACALLLARLGHRCELVDARPLEAARADRRLLALSRGTLLVLESLLGTRFAPMAQIERVLVSSRGEPGSALLDARDVGAEASGARSAAQALGATVWYADLVDALARACAAQEADGRIRVQRPRRAVATTQTPDAVRVVLDDGSGIEACLAVDAEGNPPRLADTPARDLALLAELELPGMHAGDAVERFTREGPIALLPLPQAPGAGGAVRMSMIWCLDAQVARTRMELADEALLAQIGLALGPRIGAPAAIRARSVFPLLTHRRDRICEHRLVHLGNAAQSLHPVAGQGFNLGMRDCACLAEALRDAVPDGAASESAAPRLDVLRALDLYRRRRRADRSVLPALTAALPRVFSSKLLPLAVARSLGLVALDLLPGPRRALTRLLMLGTPR